MATQNVERCGTWGLSQQVENGTGRQLWPSRFFDGALCCRDVAIEASIELGSQIQLIQLFVFILPRFHVEFFWNYVYLLVFLKVKHKSWTHCVAFCMALARRCWHWGSWQTSVQPAKYRRPLGAGVKIIRSRFSKWDIYNILWWFMGCYGILWWFYGILWWFMVISWWFMGFYGDLWDFMVIYGISWWFYWFFMVFLTWLKACSSEKFQPLRVTEARLEGWSLKSTKLEGIHPPWVTQHVSLIEAWQFASSRSCGENSWWMTSFVIPIPIPVTGCSAFPRSRQLAISLPGDAFQGAPRRKTRTTFMLRPCGIKIENSQHHNLRLVIYWVVDYLG